MTSATGNLVRDTILYDALRKLGGSSTFEETVAALPPDFDLDEMEYSGAIKILKLAPHQPLMIETTPAGTPLAPEPVEVVEEKFSNDIHGTIAPSDTNERVGELPIEPVEERLTLAQANDAVLDAENALGEARLALRNAQQRTKDARAALANAVTIWQTGLPVYSAERNVRDHLRASQAARRQRIELGGPTATTPPGKSYLDRAAKYGRDQSPEGAARSRMMHGAHRGAFPTSAKFQDNHDPRRGPVAKPRPKLPSEL
jgi:hypothetical protein